MESARVQRLPCDRVACAPQVRETFDPTSLAELAASMKEVGQQQPILVRLSGDGWIVVDGERRLRAAKLAGFETISAIVDENDLSPADVTQRQLIANVQRADLRPVEKARAIDRLMKEANWSAAQAAAKLGLSPSSVSKLLTLLVLPEESQRQVDAGALAASTAYEVAKIRDAGERSALLSEARDGRLTRKTVTGRRRSRTAAAPAPDTRPRAPRVRSRVTIPLGDKAFLSLASPETALGSLVAWLDALAARLRELAASGASVGEAAETIAGGSREKGATTRRAGK